MAPLIDILHTLVLLFNGKQDSDPKPVCIILVNTVPMIWNNTISESAWCDYDASSEEKKITTNTWVNLQMLTVLL